MGAVMCGDSMMNAWKRENVILGGWMLYISISYRILASLANNPDTVEDMYCYGCRMFGPLRDALGKYLWDKYLEQPAVAMEHRSCTRICQGQWVLSFYFKD